MNPDTRKFPNIPQSLKESLKENRSGSLLQMYVRLGVPVMVVLTLATGIAIQGSQSGDEINSNPHQITIDDSFVKELHGQQITFEFDNVIGKIDLNRKLVVADQVLPIEEFYQQGRVKLSANGTPYLTQGGKLEMTFKNPDSGSWLGQSESEVNSARTHLAVWETSLDSQGNKGYRTVIENLIDERRIEITARSPFYNQNWAGDKFIFSSKNVETGLNQVIIYDNTLEKFQAVDYPFSISTLIGSPDGSKVVVVSRDGKHKTGLQILDLVKQEVTTIYRNKDLGAFSVSWDNTSSKFAVVAHETSTGEPRARIYSINSLTEVQIEIPTDIYTQSQPMITYDPKEELWIVDWSKIEGYYSADQTIENVVGGIVSFDSTGEISANMSYRIKK